MEVTQTQRNSLTDNADGYSKLNKILDKKIIQEFKFLEKQGIMREVKGENKT